jgi:hypothetical protein
MAETDPFLALTRNAFASVEDSPPVPVTGLRINSRRGLIAPRVPAAARAEYDYLFNERVAILVFDSYLSEPQAEAAALDELGCLEFWFYVSASYGGLQKAA